MRLFIAPYKTVNNASVSVLGGENESLLFCASFVHPYLKVDSWLCLLRDSVDGRVERGNK